MYGRFERAALLQPMIFHLLLATKSENRLDLPSPLWQRRRQFNACFHRDQQYASSLMCVCKNHIFIYLVRCFYLFCKVYLINLFRSLTSWNVQSTPFFYHKLASNIAIECTIAIMTLKGAKYNNDATICPLSRWVDNHPLWQKQSIIQFSKIYEESRQHLYRLRTWSTGVPCPLLLSSFW